MREQETPESIDLGQCKDRPVQRPRCQRRPLVQGDPWGAAWQNAEPSGRRRSAPRSAGQRRTTPPGHGAAAASPLCPRARLREAHRSVALSELTNVTAPRRSGPPESGGKRAHIALGIFVSFHPQERRRSLLAGGVVPAGAHGPLLVQGLCREKQTRRLRGRRGGNGLECRYVCLSVCLSVSSACT